MDIETLANWEFVPVRKDSEALSDLEATDLLGSLPHWRIVEENGQEQLRRSFDFPDFAKALAFTNEIGQLSEAANHHPALLTEWGKVTISWWTHVVGGLHMNDYIMAARCERAYAELGQIG